MILQDLLKPNLNLVFCGTAVGDASAKKQAYYAGPGNQFYPILYKAGLINEPMRPDGYKSLLTQNIGLTDMVKRISGNDNVLTSEDFDRSGFKRKIIKYQPKIVCFNGKKAAAEYLGKKTKQIKYGLLNESIANTKLYCAPSTSGSARRYWDESYWLKLNDLIQ